MCTSSRSCEKSDNGRQEGDIRSKEPADQRTDSRTDQQPNRPIPYSNKCPIFSFLVRRYARLTSLGGITMGTCSTISMP